MSNKNETPIFEANMESAVRRHYQRTKNGALDLRMPFDRLMSFEDALRLEDDGIEAAAADGGIGDYEMRQRVIGVRAFLRWLKMRVGLSPTATYRPGPISNILMQLFAAGRAMGDPFFSSMSFTETGMLFSQTKAAASHRSKLISGLMEKAGAKGIRQLGQKTPESSASYAAVAKGNKNRKGGKRQGSFLRKLNTPPSPRKGGSHIPAKPRQQTFTRRLTGNGPNTTHETHVSGGRSPREGASHISNSGGSPREGASHIRRVA